MTEKSEKEKFAMHNQNADWAQLAAARGDIEEAATGIESDEDPEATGTDDAKSIQAEVSEKTEEVIEPEKNPLSMGFTNGLSPIG